MVSRLGVNVELENAVPSFGAKCFSTCCFFDFSRPILCPFCPRLRSTAQSVVGIDIGNLASKVGVARNRGIE